MLNNSVPMLHKVHNEACICCVVNVSMSLLIMFIVLYKKSAQKLYPEVFAQLQLLS